MLFFLRHCVMNQVFNIYIPSRCVIQMAALSQEQLRKKLLWEGNSRSALGYEVSDPPPGLEQGP